MNTKCPCGNRPRHECPGEWEPGCSLGNDAKHVVAAPASVAERLNESLGLLPPIAIAELRAHCDMPSLAGMANTVVVPKWKVRVLCDMADEYAKLRAQVIAIADRVEAMNREE